METQYKTLACCHHHTMSTLGQTDKSKVEWIRCIRNRRINSPGRPHFLTIHQPTTLEASSNPTKNYVSYKICTQLDSLPSEILHSIDMCHAGLLHCNKLKPILLKLTQHPPVIHAYTSYEFKYFPFDYHTHYYHIKYVWEYRRLGPKNPVHKWGK